MNLDDPVCLCFHVSGRKIVRFIKVEKPRRASQLSECFGAGTGCGWCRPFLRRLLAEHGESAEQATEPDTRSAAELLPEYPADFQQYQAARLVYRKQQPPEAPQPEKYD